MTPVGSSAFGVDMSMFTFFEMELDTEQKPEAKPAPTWSVQVAPSTDAEKLVAAAASAALAAHPDLASHPSSLGQALLAALPGGTRVVVRRTLPPSSSRSKDPASSLKNLRHEFLVVSLASGEVIVVEARFRSHFDLSRASPAYKKGAAALPELVVLAAPALHDVITTIVGYAAAEFKSKGEPLPPWRTLPAQLSKWLAKDFVDTPLWGGAEGGRVEGGPRTFSGEGMRAVAVGAGASPAVVRHRTFSPAAGTSPPCFQGPPSAATTVTSESEPDTGGSPVSVLPGGPRPCAWQDGAGASPDVATAASNFKTHQQPSHTAGPMPAFASAIYAMGLAPCAGPIAAAAMDATPLRRVMGFNVPPSYDSPKAQTKLSSGHVHHGFESDWERLVPKVHVVKLWAGQV